MALCLALVALPSVKSYVMGRVEGRESDNPSALELVRRAGQETVNARTAGVEILLAAASPAVIRGSINFQDESGTMTAPLNVVAPGVDGTVDALKVSSVLYVRTARLAELSAGAASWLRIDVKSFTGGPGRDSLAALDSVDPDGVLSSAVFLATFFFGSTNEVLRGGSAGLYDDARAVGEERIRGADTTHYELVVNQGRALGPGSGGTVDGVDTVTADAWLDRQGRFRRSRIDVTGPSMDGTSGAGASLEFFDFGTDVDVHAPAARETASPSEFLELHSRARRP